MATVTKPGKFVWKRLFEDFPDLYGGDCFDFSVRDGWFQIIYDLSKEISGSGAKCVQCKQKFGGLRYYHIFIGPDAEAVSIEDSIKRAEARAWETCENCGGAGGQFIADNGWVNTLCADCGDRERRNPSRL